MSIKENVEVELQSAVVGLEERGFSFWNRFKAMPRWKRNLGLGLFFAIIPVYLISRFGTDQYLSVRYGREALSAHAAFSASQDPIVSSVSIVKNPNGTSSAYATVTNPNLDLSATGIVYQASFMGSNKETIYTTTGSLYLLPNEKKYIVIPKIETVDVSSGAISLTNINWQKKLSFPEVKLKASEPIVYDEANPLNFVAEGSVINDSPFSIGNVRLVFLLYNANNRIIGVSQREESRIVPFGRRAYKQLWPGLYRSEVRKVQVIPYTNTIDPLNITTETPAGTPIRDDREPVNNAF